MFSPASSPSTVSLVTFLESHPFHLGLRSEGSGSDVITAEVHHPCGLLCLLDGTDSTPLPFVTGVFICICKSFSLPFKVQFYVNPSERNGCAGNPRKWVCPALELLMCLNASVRKRWEPLVWYCCHLRQEEQGRWGPPWRGQASGVKYYHVPTHGPFPHQLKPKDDYYISPSPQM